MATFRDIMSGPVKITGAGRLRLLPLRTVFVFPLFVFLVLASFLSTGSGAEEYAAKGVAQRGPLHLRAFFIMAYFNLGLVVAILFIVALWRWW